VSLTPSNERLVSRLRGSGFAHVSLRTDALSLELRRTPVVRPRAPEPEAVRSEPATRLVPAPAPGIVVLATVVGAAVAAGDELATIEVHRRTVPIVAVTSGTVADIVVSDGAFVAYGEVVLAITLT